MKASQTENTETKPFVVEWPKDLKIEPLYTVSVSKNFEARVYAYDEEVINSKTGEVRGSETKYLIRTMHKTKNTRWRGCTTGYEPREGRRGLLSVRLRIEEIARELMPKVTKTVSSCDETDS